jgi:hypothetical protein
MPLACLTFMLRVCVYRVGYISIIIAITCAQQCYNGGTCAGMNVCVCSIGYGGDDCTEVIPTTSCGVCTNGFCSTPTQCTCYPGWTENGDQGCTIPLCYPGCVHGTCGNDHRCICESGWSGPICNTTVCDSIACKNGGSCTGANQCTCEQYWSGSDCSIYQCNSLTCVQGTCASPTQCNCDATKWTGLNCSIAVCSEGCDTQHATCDQQPGTCTCIEGSGWSGVNCTAFTCTSECQNGGTCISPNLCQCQPGKCYMFNHLIDLIFRMSCALCMINRLDGSSM